MKQNDQKYSLLIGVISLIVGILIALNPSDAGIFAIRLLGIAVLAISCLQFISFISALRKGTANWGFTSFFILLLLVSSVVVIIKPELIQGLFIYMLGTIVALMGIWQFITLSRLRKIGAIVKTKYYLSPLLFVVCGIVSMFFSVEVEQTLICIVGILVALFGVTEILGFFVISTPTTNSDPTHHIEQ